MDWVTIRLCSAQTGGSFIDFKVRGAVETDIAAGDAVPDVVHLHETRDGSGIRADLRDRLSALRTRAR